MTLPRDAKGHFVKPPAGTPLPRRDERGHFVKAEPPSNHDPDGLEFWVIIAIAVVVIVAVCWIVSGAQL